MTRRIDYATRRANTNARSTWTRDHVRTPVQTTRGVSFVPSHLAPDSKSTR